MKRLFLVFVLLVAAGCGGGTKPAAIPAGADLRADIMVKNTAGTLDIEALFYFSSPVAPGVKTSNPKEFIEVADPALNDSPMTLEKNSAGQPVYKLDAAKWAPENTLSAKLGDKQYVGKTALDKLPGNKMTTVTFMPKQ